MEKKAPAKPSQTDFSDDDNEFLLDLFSFFGGSGTSAPLTLRPEPKAEYCDSEEENDDDDGSIQQPDEDEDDGMPWRTTAWLEDAIRESIGKVEKYNESMGLLAQQKQGDGNCPIEWDELRGNLYREMRYQKGLRSDLHDLLARKKNR